MTAGSRSVSTCDGEGAVGRTLHQTETHALQSLRAVADLSKTRGRGLRARGLGCCKSLQISHLQRTKWRRRESNENTRVKNRNGNAANGLNGALPPVSTSGPRTGDSHRHQVALSGNSDDSPLLDYMAERWPHLQPHVREAIITLIDCSASACPPKEVRHEPIKHSTMNEKTLALLVDGENIGPTFAEEILHIADTLGVVSVHIVFGDFRRPSTPPWQSPMVKALGYDLLIVAKVADLAHSSDLRPTQNFIASSRAA